MPTDVDSWMRVAFVVELLTLGGVRAAYAGTALGGKKGRRFKEQPVVVVGMVVGGIVFYGVFFAYLFSWDPQWLYIGLPDAVRWAALVASLLPLGFLLWVFKAIGTAGAKYVVTSDDQELVTTGPYARIRHPMYSWSIVWAITLLLYTDHWGVGGAFLGFLLFVVAVRVPSEEQVLIEHFGDEYLAYMARTGRYWPRTTRHDPSERSEP